MRNHFFTNPFQFLFVFILIFSSLFISGEIVEKSRFDAAYSWFGKLFDIEQNVTAQTTQTGYVAADLETCSNYTPCYTNTEGVDGPNGVGTGLREAVTSLNPGDEIIILGNYTIKDHTVLIDKNLTIRGSENAILTYNGDDCSMPMLNITAGGVLQELRINSGSCSGDSRDLILIDTTQDFNVQHNTLQNGNRAINIIQNDGSVTVAFNHITDNLDYALYQEIGTGNGSLEIYANNIFGNKTGVQVYCSGNGSADHNFWGDGILPGAVVENCDVADGKRLGAPITIQPGIPGVQAVRQPVSENFNYAFDNNIGVKRNSGNDFDLIIVNHGQGSEDNIPFLDSGSTPILACSNIYDIFLAKGASAANLVLSIKYDLNNSCVNTIESSDFCAQDDASKYPLWWYDPFNNLTGGWDRTGQIPEGDNPLNVEGQLTTCNMAANEIEVVIDSSGHPGIEEDLNFTPFLAGLPVGISNITAFDANFDVDQVDVYWETAQESRISGYRVLRGNSESGPYYSISDFIASKGSNSIYEFTDTLSSAEYNKNYHYKIEIINTYGDILRTHGPISLLTSTPTPSPTPTRTLYPTRTPYPTSTTGPTRTATRYIFRSPTPIYRPFTSTPYGTPTKVRTDRPTSTANTPTSSITAENSITPTPDSFAPTLQDTSTLSMKTDAPTDPVSSVTPRTTVTVAPTQSDYNNDGILNNEQDAWIYLLMGSITGLGFLGAASLYLYKNYFL